MNAPVAPDTSAWRPLLVQLLKRDDLVGWEGIFCASLARTGRPSVQQLEALELIARRLGLQP